MSIGLNGLRGAGPSSDPIYWLMSVGMGIDAMVLEFQAAILIRLSMLWGPEALVPLPPPTTAEEHQTRLYLFNLRCEQPGQQDEPLR